jgi:hypothetical protein
VKAPDQPREEEVTQKVTKIAKGGVAPRPTMIILAKQFACSIVETL